MTKVSAYRRLKKEKERDIGVTTLERTEKEGMVKELLENGNFRYNRHYPHVFLTDTEKFQPRKENRRGWWYQFSCSSWSQPQNAMSKCNKIT